MDDNLKESVTAVLTFFFQNLYQETYLGEINKIIDEHEVLPTLDKNLLDEVALVWCLSYYLMPIIGAYRESDQLTQLSEIIGDFTGIKNELVLLQNDKAVDFLSSGPLGAFQFYWFLFNKIGNNQVPVPRDPFVAPMFTLIATQLVEYGANGLQAIKENY